MEPRELATVSELLQWGTHRFVEAGIICGHGIASPEDEAAYLLLHALSLPESALDAALSRAVTAAERESVLALFERRARERVPAAYLTRSAWLAGRRFYVDERVLIPRSFLAELVSEGLGPWLPRDLRLVLDLCTGSGCLAVLLAEAFPRARVDATDVSTPALEVARRNIDEHGLGARVRLRRSDLFDALEPASYDLVVGNPPYVTPDSMAALPPEHRHEPRHALEGGADGLDVLRRVLARAASYLSPHGVLVAEVGHGGAALRAAFPRLGFRWLETSGGPDAVFLITRADLAGGA